MDTGKLSYFAYLVGEGTNLQLPTKKETNFVFDLGILDIYSEIPHVWIMQFQNDQICYEVSDQI